MVLGLAAIIVIVLSDADPLDYGRQRDGIRVGGGGGGGGGTLPCTRSIGHVGATHQSSSASLERRSFTYKNADRQD